MVVSFEVGVSIRDGRWEDPSKNGGESLNPYIPGKLPPKEVDFSDLIGLIGDANAALARYDGLLQGIVNPEVLLSPLTTQEAVLSSRIEGTQATLDEVLEHEAGEDMPPDKTQDIHEIINYRKTMRLAAQELKHRPITLSLIKEMHSLLMSSVRGADKNPGSFRVEQNYIAPLGTPIERATFIPPNPMILVEHLESWEQYLSHPDKDALTQTAIVHAQFELIHPFMDGNGRIGRLLIPLFLVQRTMLSSPMFYLSGYLEAHREEYYGRLKMISQVNDWHGWIKFFLQAVVDQSKKNCIKVKGMHDLYASMKEKIVAITHSQFAINTLDAIFEVPVFITTDFVTRSRIPTRATALNILRQLTEEGILKVLRKPSGRRPGRLCFRELINLTEGRDVV
jgi:Fic family protein